MERRKTVFAGSWYPGSAAACEQEIRQFLEQESQPDLPDQQWMTGIVPHAGWYYSGQIACQVINRLKGAKPIDLVVLFGMHLHPSSPNFMMPEGAWETPFGDLPVAAGLAADLMERYPFELETPKRFNQDNTIELQLPFVKYLLDPKAFLGIGVAPSINSLDIGRSVVNWARDNDKQIRIIGSTDLTHYGANYGYSPKGSGQQAVDWVRNQNDRQVIDAMLAMHPEQILEEARARQNACCAGAAATAVAGARHFGATRAQTVAYATSYDKSPGDSFVGYVGVVFA